MSIGDIALLILEIIGGATLAVLAASALLAWWVRSTWDIDP